MSTAPPTSEFTPTGVWLEHFGNSKEPPAELFREFASTGGTGVILDILGWPVPIETTMVIEITKELGLQTILMISYRVLLRAAQSNTGLPQLSEAIELADAVLVTFRADREFDVGNETSQQLFQASVQVEGSPVDLSGQLPEKPWLVLAGPEKELPRDIWRVYPGPLIGFMLDRPATLDDNTPFPSPQEARDSVDEWVKNLDGLDPVFYFVPIVDPNAPSASTAAIPDIAAAVREVGVRALVIHSQEYERYPEIKEVVGRLAGFPDEITAPIENGRIIGRHEGEVNTVAVTPDGQVVSGGGDGFVRLWDLAGGGEREPLGRHDGQVVSVAVTPDGQVVSGGHDRFVRLWDLGGGEEREPLGRHDGSVYSVAVMPDGQVVSGGDGGFVRLWDLGGGEEREPLGRHDGWVSSVAVTPGGQVVSGGEDGFVRLWDLSGGEEREPLGRHDGQVFSVAVTPEGQVVSGGEDGTIRLWDLSGGDEREPLGRHDGPVLSVAVTRDGQVVSGGYDGTVRLWDIPPPGPLPEPQQVSAVLRNDQPLDRDGIAAPDRLGYRPPIVAGRLRSLGVGQDLHHAVDQLRAGLPPAERLPPVHGVA